MKIATGASRHSIDWTVGDWSWSELLDRLRTPHRTSETVSEFAAMPPGQKAGIKDVGGFVGGELVGGRRKRTNAGPRHLLTLDVDHPEPGLWEDLTMLYDFRCALYSTHSHTPQRPRLRLVAALSRPCSPEEYQPVARRVAQWLGIDQFDDTTYEVTRLMYWPSCPADGEWVFEHQVGPGIDVDEVLATYRDWRDVAEWPRSSRESALPAHRGGRQADPTGKPGIVGAFCRAYSVTAAIETFLPGVYAPTAAEDRWTFVAGESAGGLVIYDGDTFAYSHHATDPAGGQMVNAFDLVRLHRFAELDANTKPDTPTNRLPSYKAMCDLAGEDKTVKALVISERRAQAEAEFEPLPEGAVLDTSWVDDLEVDSRGRPRDTLPNVVRILEKDQRLSGIIWNELSGGIDLCDTSLLPWRRLSGAGWTDADRSSLQVYIAQSYGIYAPAKLDDALRSVTTQQRRRHPIKEWLAGLPEWDGTQRLDTLLVDHLGAEDNPYVRAVTRKLVVAMVARAHRPGVKFDHVVVLQGPQGIGKSVLCSRLGGPWFSDSLALSDMRDKTAAEKVQGRWLCELSEMSGMRKTEVEVVKAFVTRTDDQYRTAYGRVVESRPRTAVFVGTTNDSDGFLRDVTGNRRFWPVRVSGGDPRAPWDITDDELAQVFAEAMVRYSQNEPLYLPAELSWAALQVQQESMEADDRIGLVEAFLDRELPPGWMTMTTFERREWLASEFDAEQTVPRDAVSLVEIWAEAFGKNPAEMTRRDSYALAAIMARTDGWEKTSEVLMRRPYGKQRLYRRSR